MTQHYTLLHRTDWEITESRSEGICVYVHELKCKSYTGTFHLKMCKSDKARKHI